MVKYHYTDSCETQCPYCDYKQQYGGDPLKEDESIEVECDNCERSYRVTCSVSVSHYCTEIEQMEGISPTEK